MDRFRTNFMVFALLAFTATSVAPSRAFALDHDQKNVVTMATYGMVIGTVAGVAAWPFHKQLRSVLMGTSIGLYLGIAVGLYYINNRNDPGNPLAERALGDGLDRTYDPLRSFQLRTPGDYVEPVPQLSFRLASFDVK